MKIIINYIFIQGITLSANIHAVINKGPDKNVMSRLNYSDYSVSQSKILRR